MNIKRLPVRIARMTALSPSAQEVTLTLPEPLGFTPGAFVNVFMTENGQRVRRAYSISSDDAQQKEITLSIRKGSPGGMSERFWEEGIEKVPFEIMGPLGLNTADKITHPRVFLFAFGIGVSVIKGLLHHLLAREDITEITVMTGSRSEEEVLYKGFFETAAAVDSRLSVRYVVSKPVSADYLYQGYLQDHLDGLDFNDSTVYICGTGAACVALKEAIEQRAAVQPEFLIESFE